MSLGIFYFQKTLSFHKIHHKWFRSTCKITFLTKNVKEMCWYLSPFNLLQNDVKINPISFGIGTCHIFYPKAFTIFRCFSPSRSKLNQTMNQCRAFWCYYDNLCVSISSWSRLEVYVGSTTWLTESSPVRHWFFFHTIARHYYFKRKKTF